MPEARSKRAAALRNAALFAGLSEKKRDFVAEPAVLHNVRAGQLIFTEGEPCQGLYVVQSGAIEIFKTSPGGREQVLTVEGPGGSVAELPVFDGGDYPASALSNASLLFVSKKDFQALCLGRLARADHSWSAIVGRGVRRAELKLCASPRRKLRN